MPIQRYIKQMKDLQNLLLLYINSENPQNEEYEQFISFLQNQGYHQKKHELIELLSLIASISNNYHRTSIFFDKIEKILIFLKNDIKQTISNSEIINIFQNSKRILYFIFDNIIPFDEAMYKFLKEKNDKQNNYIQYFHKFVKKIDKTATIDEETFSEEKCLIGENDSYLCSLIRNDSVIEFIQYCTKSNISLSNAQLNQSIFETNLFLIDKSPTLIEYASFYGSIQIFQYLKTNKAKLSPSLWLFAIHGQNEEIISFLIDNKIQPNDKTYVHCIEESIKCHNEDITNFIIDNLIHRKIESEKLLSNGFHYHNYLSISIAEINYKILLYYSCKYNYPKLVELILTTTKEIDINSKIKDDTPLHLASIENNQEIIKILLSQPDIKIGEEMFCGCEKLRAIEIPNNIKTLGKSSFKNCTLLTQIILPSSIESIEEYSFYNCKSLIEITIPEKVKIISKNCFCCCSSLTKVTIKGTINLVEEHAFHGCSSLKDIEGDLSDAKINREAFMFCSIDINKVVKKHLKINFAGNTESGKTTIINQLLLNSKSSGKVEKSSKSSIEKLLVTKYNKLWLIDHINEENCFENMIHPHSCYHITILVIDSTKDDYLNESTKQLIFLTSLSSFYLIVAINKFDYNSVNYDQKLFDTIKNKITEFISNCNLNEDQYTFIPISSLVGDNINSKSMNFPWWAGSSLFELLSNFTAPQSLLQKPLNATVNHIFDSGSRPRVDIDVFTGSLKPGYPCYFPLTNVKIHPYEVSKYEVNVMTTVPGDNVIAKFNVPNYEIKRGDILTDVNNIRKPCIIFTAIINLLNLKNDWKLRTGFEVTCQFINSRLNCKIVIIINKCNIKGPNDEFSCLQNNDSALVAFQAIKPISVLSYNTCPLLCRFNIFYQNDKIGYGIVQSIDE